jgi:hypothetical protein
MRDRSQSERTIIYEPKTFLKLTDKTALISGSTKGIGLIRPWPTNAPWTKTMFFVDALGVV